MVNSVPRTSGHQLDMGKDFNSPGSISNLYHVDAVNYNLVLCKLERLSWYQARDMYGSDKSGLSGEQEDTKHVGL